MRRAPLWLVVVVGLLIVGLIVYGYFTAPLPFGLSSLVRSPFGGTATGGSGVVAAPPGARASAGQPLLLGAVTIVVESVQRSQELAQTPARGPAGAFAIVRVQIQNGGSEPLVLQPASFRLLDDRGRAYAVDPEATRAAAQVDRRRDPFEASVSPGTGLATTLAFGPAADAQTFVLRASLGYGELELPR